MSVETQGFIDSASIHGAITALMLGRSETWDRWTQQSILESTYLLLHSNIGMIPGPGPFHGAAGALKQVFQQLPNLHNVSLDRAIADRKTRQWLSRYPEKIKQAWVNLKNDPNSLVWKEQSINLFWENHSRMHGSLFNQEYIPTIARLLDGPTEKTLQNIYELSKNPNQVKNWRKAQNCEDALIAQDAWCLSALIRGKYHEFLAKDEQLQLISHPFRYKIQKKLTSTPGIPITNSEQLFTKMLIGASLSEISMERRVDAWVSNINKSRQAIEQDRLYLPDSTTIEIAERMASKAALEAELTSTPKLLIEALDLGFSMIVGGIISISIAPWMGPIGPALLMAYKYSTGQNISTKIARSTIDTRRRFAKLGEMVPGRINRNIAWLKDE